MLVSFWAAAAKKTVLPRWMLIFHLIPVQLALMLIPDVRQALGGGLHLGFCAEPGVGERGTFVLDAGQRPLGAAAGQTGGHSS